MNIWSRAHRRRAPDRDFFPRARRVATAHNLQEPHRTAACLHARRCLSGIRVSQHVCYRHVTWPNPVDAYTSTEANLLSEAVLSLLGVPLPQEVKTVPSWSEGSACLARDIAGRAWGEV